MKKIYVCHPFQGKKSNKESITHICQYLAKRGVMPISPVHSFSYLNDNIPEERAKAMEFCLELLEVCDCIFFFGDYENSEGCRMEMDLAKQLFKPFYVVTGWFEGKPVFNGNGPVWWKGERK